MSTLDSSKIVYDLLKNKGRYPGDPPIVRCYQYVGYYNYTPLYKIYYYKEHDQLLMEFPDAVLLFEDGSLTEAGKLWIEEYEVEKVK